jgi:transcriptional regulator with XRE-family HTH domain
VGAAGSEEAARWSADFGLRVVELRTERKLSQLTLAHAAGLDPTYISSVERGRRNVTLSTIYVLARALGVSPADMLKAPR